MKADKTTTVPTSAGPLAISDLGSGRIRITDLAGQSRDLVFPIPEKYGAIVAPVKDRFDEETARDVVCMAISGNLTQCERLASRWDMPEAAFEALVLHVSGKTSGSAGKAPQVAGKKASSAKKAETVPAAFSAAKVNPESEVGDLWLRWIHGDEAVLAANDVALGKSDCKTAAAKVGVSSSVIYNALKRDRVGKRIDSPEAVFATLEQFRGKDFFSVLANAANGDGDMKEVAKACRVTVERASFLVDRYRETFMTGGTRGDGGLLSGLSETLSDAFVAYAMKGPASGTTVTELAVLAGMTDNSANRLVSELRKSLGVATPLVKPRISEGKLTPGDVIGAKLYLILAKAKGFMDVKSIREIIEPLLPLNRADMTPSTTSRTTMRWHKTLSALAVKWKRLGWLVGSGRGKGWKLTPEGISEIPKTYA